MFLAKFLFKEFTGLTTLIFIEPADAFALRAIFHVRVVVAYVTVRPRGMAAVPAEMRKSIPNITERYFPGMLTVKISN